MIGLGAMVLLIAFVVILVMPDGFGRSRWESVYESGMMHQADVARRLSILKAHSIPTRTKTVLPAASPQFQSANASMQGTVRILVQRKNLARAYQVLSDHLDD